ncbi:Integrase core domain protein [Escherichia coli]|nr:Integrase core domain protein [Escherichia coli]RDQ53464.1 Integrase core domain protein [Escherichia coli]
MKLMKEEGLVCRQRRAYKVTTKSREGAEVAPNLLNQNFNPPAIMDLFSRRIVGWHVDSRMTSSLICRVLMKAYNLLNPPRSLVVHTDSGSQYTGSRFQALLGGYGLRSSMGDVGACWDMR